MNYCQLSKNSKYPRHQKKWKKSFVKKLGGLAQGGGERVDGSYTMFFIAQDQMPRERLKDISYGSIILDYRPHKEEPHRTRLTVGGNLIVYSGDVITPKANFTTENLIINSTISTPGARYMCCNIKIYT